MDELRFFAPIEKYDPKEHMVYGYASTEALDSQGEIVQKTALASAIDDYMDFANIREMHQPSAVGKTKKAQLDNKGLYIAAKIVDKGAWEKVEEGVYNGFSIGGKVIMKKGNTITDLSLSEISLVDRPANPECRFDVWKMDGAKPEEEKPVVEEKPTEEQPKVEEKKTETPVETPEKPKDEEKTKADKAETLKKCMSDVGRLAMIVEQLSSYKEQAAWEELMEGDDSDIPQRVDDAVQLLAGILKDRVNEETDELNEKGTNGAVNDTDPQGPMYMADKTKDLSKIDQYLAKGEMPDDKEIVEILKSMKLEPDQKAIDAFRWEFSGKIMSKIKQDQDALMQKGDGKQPEKKEEIKKADVPVLETAAPANTTITDALAALNTAVQTLTAAMAKPYANRPEYNNSNELTPDEQDKLKNGVKAGSERTSSDRMTENATVQTGKADIKVEVAKVDGTKDQAYVAKLEADLSALKGDVQKLMDTPNPVKPKATYVYYTLEKGHEEGNTSDLLAVKEKRSLEIQDKYKKGTQTEADIQEAAQLSIDIMKLRREADIRK